MAWQFDRSVVLARYPTLDVLAMIDDDVQFPTLAMAAPDRGAIAWMTHDPESLRVATFEQIGDLIVLGDERTISTVSTDLSDYKAIVGLVHLDDDRYVLAWFEQPSGSMTTTRTYAVTLALTGS